MWQPIVTRNRARRLRREMSLPEVLLWRELRRAASPDCKFRRQHPFGPYVLDFYCEAAWFCVEIDGSTHGGDREWDDRSRDAFLRERGIGTLRIRAWRVLDNPEYVAERLIAWTKHLSAQRRRP